MSPLLVPLILLSPVLLVTAYCDLRYMRIPNLLSLLAIPVFLLTVPLIGLPEAGMRLSAAALVFAVGVAGFALRLLGGGDVKILAVLISFIPSATWTLYMLVFAGSLLAGLIAIVAWRAVPQLHVQGWVSATAPGTFPMGISVALSGLAHPFVVIALS